MKRLWILRIIIELVTVVLIAWSSYKYGTGDLNFSLFLTDPDRPPPPKLGLKIVGAKPLCKGCPSDHSTFLFSFQNDSDKAIKVTGANLNLREHFYRVVPNPIPDPNPTWKCGCKDGNPKHIPYTTVEFKVDSTTAGRPIPLDHFDAFEIPPSGTLDVRVQITRRHSHGIIGWGWFGNPDSKDVCYHACGKITFIHDGGVVASEELLISGESPPAAPSEEKDAHYSLPPARGKVRVWGVQFAAQQSFSSSPVSFSVFRAEGTLRR